MYIYAFMNTKKRDLCRDLFHVLNIMYKKYFTLYILYIFEYYMHFIYPLYLFSIKAWKFTI